MASERGVARRLPPGSVRLQNVGERSAGGDSPARQRGGIGPIRGRDATNFAVESLDVRAPREVVFT